MEFLFLLLFASIIGFAVESSDDPADESSGDDSIPDTDPVFWNGTENNDTYVHDGRGVIAGLGGDDMLEVGGYSQAEGGSGDDTISVYDLSKGLGGQGDDTMVIHNEGVGVGGSGDDSIWSYDATKSYGGAGQDYMFANRFAEVTGGSGDDHLVINNQAKGGGGEGDDYIVTRHSARAWGGMGDDTIDALDNSTVVGNSGDDLLNLSDNAVAYGRQGSDSFVLNDKSTGYGESGSDDFLMADTATAYGGAGNDTFSDAGKLGEADRGGAVTGYGGAGDDTFEGYGLATYYGGSGDDVYFARLMNAADKVYGGSGDDTLFMGRGGEGSGGSGDDIVVADGNGTISGGAGNDLLVFERTVAMSSTGALDNGMEPTDPAQIDITATGGEGNDGFLLSNEMFHPDIQNFDGTSPEAGSAAEADLLATAFPAADMIGTITDFNPTEDTLLLELPETSTGYALGAVTTQAVAGETAVDVSITMTHATDPGQPDMVRTIRLVGTTTFDTASLVQIEALGTPPAAATT